MMPARVRITLPLRRCVSLPNGSRPSVAPSRKKDDSKLVIQRSSLNAPMHGSTRRPIASLTSIDGKSAPAWIVSGMPPEKRGLISKMTGCSCRMRHWMLIAPAKRMAAHAASASRIRRRSFTVRPRSITPARMTTRSRGTIDKRLAIEVAEHVDGELRAVEILLHDRRRYVAQEEIELVGGAHRKGAERAASDARLDEERQLHVLPELCREVRPGGGDARLRSAACRSRTCRCRATRVSAGEQATTAWMALN